MHSGFSESITSQRRHLRRPVFGCCLYLHSEERCLFSEAGFVGAQPLDIIPSFLFSAVGLHMLQLLPWAHTRFPEKRALCQTPILREEKRRQAGRPGSRTSSPQNWGGNGGSRGATSASRDSSNQRGQDNVSWPVSSSCLSALPLGKSPPASFPKSLWLLVRLILRKNC